MKPTSLQLILFFFLVVLVFSCTKTDTPDEPNPPGSGGIYATYTSGNENYNRKAVLWKDGTETDLTNNDFVDDSGDKGTALYTSAVAVSPSGDMYVAGCECYLPRRDNLYDYSIKDSCYTVLWKNGVKQNLNAKPILRWYIDSKQTSLAINGNGDVFVLGRNSDDYYKYSVWKNGNKIIDINDVGFPEDMFVNGNDVYVVGNVGNTGGSAALWKNGTLQILSGGSAYATSVYVAANNEVYVGLGNGKLLKNNVEQTLNVLPGNAIGSIEDIVGSGNDVYVLGYTGGKGIIWKNGVQLYELKNETVKYEFTNPQALFLFGNDIYAIGTLDNLASGYKETKPVVIWKNGEIYKTLNDASVGIVDAPSMFIK